MKGIGFLPEIITGLLTLGIMLPAASQVTSDDTTNTTVNSNSNNFNILNGIQKGNNLFHSFKEFSIPTGGSATFKNSSAIENIINRVTGGNISNIDGLIKANGSANLFLINPNGIVFGENASLDIGGSFLGSTAESILFEDGFEFSAVNTSGTPLLTISVPVGLQMGNSPAPIQIEGTGHAVKLANRLTPFSRFPSSTELRVQPGKTLALVGGELNLTGATITAEQGRIELGSLENGGLVNLLPISQGYQLEYDTQQNFNDINLIERSLLDVSGVNAGSMQLRGKQIRFIDGSLALGQNFGFLPGGDLFLQASAGIDIIGTTKDLTVGSAVRTDTLNIGSGGNIHVITPYLSVQNGADLNTLTSAQGKGGNINIDATVVEIFGKRQIDPAGVSSINSSTLSEGNAGDIFVNGNSLFISDGGAVASTSLGRGSSGEVRIQNTQTTIQGDNPAGIYSNINAGTFGTGDGKTLTIETQRLELLAGGSISGSSVFVGNGGDVDVKAGESIYISGRSRLNPSSIQSSSIYLDPSLRQIFGLPNILTANAGNVRITTPKLTIDDGGSINVTNEGDGNGGSIDIQANIIELKNQAVIDAKTASGNGGDISFNVSNLLLLQNNSQITATANGNGNGGNINVNSSIIAGLENSDIIANAVQGNGGNINITTQGIFGLKFSDRLTPDSDITASSQFGVNGNVEINNLDLDPSSGLVELPVALADSSQQISSGCASQTGSSFVATGRGGIPQNPNEYVKNNPNWSDIRDLSAFRKLNNNTVENTQISNQPTIIEATGFIRNAKGEIELVASANKPLNTKQVSNCSGMNT
ncbi:MAG: filamentous hemagglutinin N-terminal domain-containing protein [Cyanobacteria bacterium P01_H01_bin.150]